MNTTQKTSLILLFLSSLMTFAQSNHWNKLSIEIGYGYVQPSALYSSVYNKSDFSGFNHFDVGARYMFNKEIGLKLSYANDRFKNDDVSPTAGITFNSINVSAVYNVGSLFDLNYLTNERMGLLGHAGVGITLASPESISDSEKIGTATIGLTPQVKVSERISIYGDIAYAFHFKQHYGFDGVLLSPDYTSEVGKTATFSLGLMFYLGEKDRHADWY